MFGFELTNDMATGDVVIFHRNVGFKSSRQVNLKKELSALIKDPIQQERKRIL